jgi:peptide/nickel transport system substrate-binding protein
MRSVRHTPALAVVVALALVGACDHPQNSASGHEFNMSSTRVVNPSHAVGGTIHLGAARDVDSWDPGRAYFAWAWNMQRLYARKLVEYRSFDPQHAEALEPDLATGLGESSANFTRFAYHLKQDIKFEDGSEITSADVKYALKRIYATDVISGGPTRYYHCLLDTCVQGTPTYRGPYADPAGEPMVDGRPSIETPNSKTIIFHLSRPFAAWDYLMAMGPASPIPPPFDSGPAGGENYGQHPISSGPFKISTYDRDTGTTFVRNDYWDQATDTIRRPKVDSIVVDYISNQDDIDQRLRAGSLDHRPDGGLQPGFLGEALANPKLKRHLDTPPTGYLGYLVLMPQVKPLDNIDCRRAVFYAVDKRSFLLANGGANTGEIAHTLTPAGLPGHDNRAQLNRYPNGADHTGDLTAARAALRSCGHPDGFEVNLSYVTGGIGQARAVAVQQALARVGITVKLKPAPDLYTAIGSSRNAVASRLGVAITEWAADFPNPYGLWFVPAHGDANQPTSDDNYPDLDDPRVNELIDRSLQVPPDQWSSIERQLDDALMDAAVFVPMIYPKIVYWRAERLTNVYSTYFFGQYDVANLGVSDGR